VIALGNALRGDDAVALEVARRMREAAAVDVVETEGDPIRLLDLWAGADEVVVVDAAVGTGIPGTVTVVDAVSERLPDALYRTSTHHVSLGEAVELARVLGVLPERTVLVVVEGGDFALGSGLSPAVAAAVPHAVAQVLRCTSGS
jgi:hydrogenase maturation protease